MAKTDYARPVSGWITEKWLNEADWNDAFCAMHDVLSELMGDGDAGKDRLVEFVMMSDVIGNPMLFLCTCEIEKRVCACLGMDFDLLSRVAKYAVTQAIERKMLSDNIKKIAGDIF